MTDTNETAIKWAAEILNRFDDADLRVREFDRPFVRFTKAQIKAVAAHMGLDTAGTRSALCYRVARS